jgi:hypothetical protein
VKKIAFLLPVICLVASSLSVKADTLKAVSFGAGNDGIGPYTLSLNGKTNLQLFCLDDQLTISEGESWNVNIVSGNNLTSDKVQYAEEAYIYSELGKTVVGGSHGDIFSNTEVQDALWAVFDPSDHVSGDAAKLLTLAASNYSSVNMNLYDFYIPAGGVKGSSWGDTSVPQTFLGLNPDPSDPIAPTPEPSSLILLGSGLVGMAGFVRRKLGGA